MIESLRVAVPCFCCGRRSALAKNRPLPLLRLACICRRQRLGYAARPAKHKYTHTKKLFRYPLTNPLHFAILSK